MYDLRAVIAHLRREDSELSAAVGHLTECIGCCPRTKDDIVSTLWHRENVFLHGGDETAETEALHTV